MQTCAVPILEASTTVKGLSNRWSTRERREVAWLSHPHRHMSHT